MFNSDSLDCFFKNCIKNGHSLLKMINNDGALDMQISDSYVYKVLLYFDINNKLNNIIIKIHCTVTTFYLQNVIIRLIFF
jgi:hypothetical protein